MKIAHLLILPVAVMAAVSCTEFKPETTTTANYKQGVPGGEVVKTSKITATVTAINPTNRKVTLVDSNGKKVTVKAGPEVVNFDQIRIGDQLKATLTNEVVIRMAKPGEKSADGSASMVGRAPAGSKPGALMAETTQVTVTVTAIDHKHHKATVRLADGSLHTVAVRPDVDLTKRKVGEKVVICTTEILAMQIEKP